MARPLPALFAWLTFLSGCATGAPVGGWTGRSEFRAFGRPAAPVEVPDDAPTRPAVLSEGAREAVVATARSYLGQRFGDDCTALVRATFQAQGVDVLSDAQPGDNGVTAIYRFALGRGRVFKGGHPLPGDLVFFKDTWDKNGDGVQDDGLTHVGLVDGVDPDGTVTVIHRVARGVVRYRMNLAHPDQRKDPKTGLPINDYLRPPGKGAAQVLTGQLFFGYGTLFTQEPSVISLSSASRLTED